MEEDAAPEEVEEFELSAINAKLNADKALTAYRSSLKNTEDLKKGNEESKIKYNQLVETVAQLKSVTASR